MSFQGLAWGQDRSSGEKVAYSPKLTQGLALKRWRSEGGTFLESRTRLGQGQLKIFRGSGPLIGINWGRLLGLGLECASSGWSQSNLPSPIPLFLSFYVFPPPKSSILRTNPPSEVRFV